MVYGVEGVWKELTLNVSRVLLFSLSPSRPRIRANEISFGGLQVNQMCANLTAQVRSIAGVTTAVAKVRSILSTLRVLAISKPKLIGLSVLG